MKYFYLLAFATLLLSCNSSDSSSEKSTIVDGEYAFEAIPGSTAKIATAGALTNDNYQRGIIKNGKKEGQWLEYYKDGRIKTIANYLDGKLTLVRLELSIRGQIEKRGEYLNGKRNGEFVEYKFGRVTNLKNFKNDMLDGVVEVFGERGKIQLKGTYKEGKQDGLLQYFDDEGNIVMEYIYKNGEKVSGGIVDKEAIANDAASQ